MCGVSVCVLMFKRYVILRINVYTSGFFFNILNFLLISMHLVWAVDGATPPRVFSYWKCIKQQIFIGYGL